MAVQARVTIPISSIVDIAHSPAASKRSSPLEVSVKNMQVGARGDGAVFRATIEPSLRVNRTGSRWRAATLMALRPVRRRADGGDPNGEIRQTSFLAEAVGVGTRCALHADLHRAACSSGLRGPCSGREGIARGDRVG